MHGHICELGAIVVSAALDRPVVDNTGGMLLMLLVNLGSFAC